MCVIMFLGCLLTYQHNTGCFHPDNSFQDISHPLTKIFYQERKMEIFAERLKLLRANTDVTQQEVADILGINVRNYRKYEAGSVNPTASNLIVLSDYFNVSIDYLIGKRLEIDVLTDRKINQWSELLYDIIIRSADADKLLREFDFELLVIGMLQSFSLMDSAENLATTEIIELFIKREFSDKIDELDLILSRLKLLSKEQLIALYHDIPNYKASED